MAQQGEAAGTPHPSSGDREKPSRTLKIHQLLHSQKVHYLTIFILFFPCLCALCLLNKHEVFSVSSKKFLSNMWGGAAKACLPLEDISGRFPLICLKLRQTGDFFFFLTLP